jgi:S1-C subfamily serine protease
MHGHLHGLATPVHEISGLGGMFFAWYADGMELLGKQFMYREFKMKKYLHWPCTFVFAIAVTVTLVIFTEVLADMPSPPLQPARSKPTYNADNGHPSWLISPESASLRQERSKSDTLRVEVQSSLVAAPQRRTFIGTAWAIASGYVVTSSHVVAESNEVVLINTLGEEIPAWTILKDESKDLALLEVSDAQRLPPALPLAATEARLGTSVFTIGFPRADVMGRTPKLSTGVISCVTGLRDNPSIYQTTMPIQPGNSGGPLVNMKGEVVGVVKSMLAIKDSAGEKFQMLQNASCVLKIDCLRDLLRALPNQGPMIDVLPRHNDSLETLAARVKDSVMIIRAR